MQRVIVKPITARRRRHTRTYIGCDLCALPINEATAKCHDGLCKKCYIKEMDYENLKVIL
jgi:hypothetical protein